MHEKKQCIYHNLPQMHNDAFAYTKKDRPEGQQWSNGQLVTQWSSVHKCSGITWNPGRIEGTLTMAYHNPRNTGRISYPIQKIRVLNNAQLE